MTTPRLIQHSGSGVSAAHTTSTNMQGLSHSLALSLSLSHECHTRSAHAQARDTRRSVSRYGSMRALPQRRFDPCVHFGSSHFLLEIPCVICSQWVRLGCGPLVLVCAVAIRRLSCVFCRDPGDCLSLVPVWSDRVGFQKSFLVTDGK